jgi:ribokinase
VVRLTVVGSVNLDLVVRCERLPRPGETIGGATFARFAGGKGANQAVAAARLGADVTFVGCVGTDDYAEDALAGLRDAGVRLELQRSSAPTGVAAIAVDAAGENTIVVAPGANADFQPPDLPDDGDAVLTQLEIPVGVVEHVAAQVRGRFFLNAAPATIARLPDAEVTIVNRHELEALGERRGVVVVTEGEAGAALVEDGVEVARARPPRVTAVDGTAAGDAFAACFVVSLLEGRDRAQALARACAAGALAASRMGAQPSLPTADEVDAILAR